MYACIFGGKKCLFFEKSGVLCFLATSVLKFVLSFSIITDKAFNKISNHVISELANTVAGHCELWNMFLAL